MPRRPDIERWLESHYLDPRFEVVPVSSIDEDRSRNNQVRLIEGAITEDRVSVYAQAIKEGAEFPPIVVRPSGKTYIIIDGNHRYFARKKNGEPQIEVYVVEPNPDKLEVLSAEVNSRNGIGMTDDERTAHFLHLVKIGMEVKPAALAAGLSGSRASTVWNLDRADRRARDLKIRGWNHLGTNVRSRLGQIRNDTAFVAAVKLAQEARPPHPDLSRFVTALNQAGTEQEMLEAVSKKDAEWGDFKQRSGFKVNESQGTRPVITDKAKLMGGLSLIAKVDVNDVIAQSLVDERYKIAEGCRTAANLLAEFASKIGTRVSV